MCLIVLHYMFIYVLFSLFSPLNTSATKAGDVFVPLLDPESGAVPGRRVSMNVYQLLSKEMAHDIKLKNQG